MPRRKSWLARAFLSRHFAPGRRCRYEIDRGSTRAGRRNRTGAELRAGVIAILVVLGQIVALPFFTGYGLGLLLIAYLILVAGVLMENL
jgi:hypothetical protein